MKTQMNVEISLAQFSNVATFKKLVDITAEEGHLVRQGAVTPWFFEGFRYQEGRPVLYGPEVTGAPLSEIMTRSREELLSAALALVRALATLSGAGRAASVAIAPSSIYFLEDGGVLFLPGEVFRKIRLMSTEEYKVTCSQISNPYADNERQRFSHLVGVLVYKALTGEFPFTGRDLDDLHTQIRHQNVTPPRHRVPELKQEVSDFILEAFTNKRLPVPLAEWETALEQWLKEGFTRQINPEEKAALEHERHHYASRHGRRFKAGVFWERHGKAVLIAGAVSVGVIIVIASFVAHYLRPRRTAGLPPLEVVKTYYQCLNTLNTELMKDCLQDNAAAEESRRVEVLYVLTKQQQYLSGSSNRHPADAWDKAGRPRVAPPAFVDGMTALRVTQEQGEPHPVFLAEFERWVMENDPNDTPSQNGFLQKGYQVKERLVLSRDNQGWRISRLERLEQTPIYSSKEGYTK